MAESKLLAQLQTKKYTYNVVRESKTSEGAVFTVVFFVNQPAHPISQTITFEFVVGDKIKFRTENNVFLYDLAQIQLETIIDREYQQKLRFSSEL